MCISPTKKQYSWKKKDEDRIGTIHAPFGNIKLLVNCKSFIPTLIVLPTVLVDGYQDAYMHGTESTEG